MDTDGAPRRCVRSVPHGRAARSDHAMAEATSWVPGAADETRGGGGGEKYPRLKVVAQMSHGFIGHGPCRVASRGNGGDGPRRSGPVCEVN